jgi:DNA-binding NarL/FixJ family response regulator
MPIRIVIADDHPLVLKGLDGVLAAEPDIEIVARCEDGVAALEALEAHRPDVLVLDIRMPELDGLGVLRAMAEKGLATRVVLLTAAIDEDEVLAAIRLGVAGVVLKEMAPQLLVRCVRTVHAGGQWLERRSVTLALERVLQREAAQRRLQEVLTPREVEIVRLVARGRRNKAIARELSISEGTVKIHVHNIYEKLGLDSRVALSDFARGQGLL